MARKRKILITAGIFLVALLILIAALPIWFPWILQPVLKKYGIRYSTYERVGYNRFILRDVEFSNAGKEFKAKRVELLLPVLLLWRHFNGDSRENFLSVIDWKMTFPDTAKTNRSGNISVYGAVEKMDPLLARLNHWLPKAALTNGLIHFRDKKIAVPSVEWNKGNLTGQISAAKLLPETFFNAQLNGNSPKQISVKIAEWTLEGKITAHSEKEILRFAGEIFWQSNRVDISADFQRNDTLPNTASAQSKSFRIPANLLKLEGYRDLAGTLDLRWESNHFLFDATAKAEPIESEVLSPVQAVIHASGGTNFIRIEHANVSSPWLSINLSSNVDFTFRGEMISPAASLNLAADLSHQKWIDATGLLKGDAVLRRGTNRFPDTTFRLAGTGVEFGELQTDKLDVQGKFDWPWLQIESAQVKFKEDATAQADLQFNAVSRTISQGKLNLDGKLGYKFLPPDISYKNISLAAQFSGPLKKLSHSAHLELRSVKLPELSPLAIVADWQGTQLNFEKFHAKISAKNSSLTLTCSATKQTNHYEAQIQQLLFTTNEQPVLNLEKPFIVSIAKNAETNWSIDLAPVQMSGAATKIALNGKIIWPQTGNFSASVKQFNFSLLQDFLERPSFPVLIEKINLLASWTNGPVTFDFGGLAQFSLEDSTAFTADLKASGDGNGVSIEQAKVESALQPVISGKGFLPVKFEPANRSNLVQILPKQRIDFHAATTTNSQFWERIATWTHTRFQDPAAQIDVTGTFDSPEGKIVLRAKEILLKPQKLDQPMPRLQNFVADFDLVRDRIALHRFEVFVESQPVTMTGELPLPKSFQTHWKNVFDWRKANVHLKIVDAQIAPFTRLFPNFLSPLGTVNLDATAKAGRLDGELRVAGAGLRPIPSLGPVHDIEARLNLAGDLVRLETFKGFIGGESVELAGEINLGKTDKTTRHPIFNFKLHGTNVPLARQPEFILRSDIDLTIGNEKGGEPLVSGALNLRDSFYLSDLKLLIPGKVAKPKQRPPYFSVEAEPFANWRLAVAVKGNNFLKVRSPLFRGELSANLKVEGTLKEPMALGDVRINSGVVQFPFANLRVDQGFVSLTSENPYQPQLQVSASSRTFGYDVKMNLHGPAEKPEVEFSSNPGLTSEQILLMITAGELPRDDVNFSTQQKAGRLAFFLGKNLFSKFGSNGAMDDKLEIRSGEEVSEQGRQTYYLEYKLTGDWSIIGEYDRFGGVNAGVKWKFFEK